MLDTRLSHQEDNGGIHSYHSMARRLTLATIAPDYRLGGGWWYNFAVFWHKVCLGLFLHMFKVNAHIVAYIQLQKQF